MSVLGNLVNVFSDIWKNIGIAQKVSIILIAVVALGAVAGILYMGSRPNWRVLYANLDTETASKVYDVVSDLNVPVKMTNGGRTIMVGSNDVYKIRMRVAGEGVQVQTKGVGFELFNEVKLGMTELQQQVALQRAVQGELQRMISEMPGVESCQVIIPFSKKKVFRKKKSKQTASIMLVMGSGYTLNNAQINSIRYMVASAIPGMKPGDVTINDNHGNLLARQLGDDETAPISTRELETKSFVERQLKNKAEAILRPVVGEDNVVAMVSCEMDFDRIDRVEEKYDSERAVIVSEKIINEDNSKKAANIGGAVSSSNNMTTTAINPADRQAEGGGGAPIAGDTMTEQRQTAERRYVVPKTVEKTIIKGGRVKKINVAVTIPEKEDGKWNVAQLEQLVSAAVGAGPKDTVTVTPMTFQPPPKVAPPSVPITDTINYNFERFTNSPLVRPLLGLALLFILYRVFKQYFAKSEVEGAEMSSGLYSEDVQSLEASEEDDEKQQLVEAAMSAIDDKTSQVSPEAIANVMEGWLRADSNF